MRSACFPIPSRPQRAQEEEWREKENERRVKFPPDPEPIEGRVCGECGGKLVLVILNYDWDRVTDAVTPADKAEKCLNCGRWRPEAKEEIA